MSFAAVKQRTNAARNWLAIKRAWAGEGPLVWLSIPLMVATVCVVFFFPGSTDLRLRLWGMILQLVGVYTVWYDLSRTAKDFDRPPFWLDIWEWLKRGRPQPRVIRAGPGSIKFKGFGPRITQRAAFDPRTPVDEQLAALNSNIKFIDDELGKLSEELNGVADQLAEQIDAEAEARAGDKDGLRKELSAAVAGNLRPLAFGVFWLAIGVFVATAAPEIAKCVNGRCAEVFDAI